MQANLKNETPKIDVAEFVEKSPVQFQIEVLAGKAKLSSRRITSTRIQKLGLALAGFAHYIHAGRVQIVGQSEISYLKPARAEKRIEAIRNLDLEKICCILTDQKSRAAAGIYRNCRGSRICPCSDAGSQLNRHRDGFQFFRGNSRAADDAARRFDGNVRLRRFDCWANSGIGKSECALDLITRGHHLIADDSVLVKKIGDKLEGTSPELTYEHLEIRGLGIINIRDLFGVSAIGKRIKKIDL